MFLPSGTMCNEIAIAVHCRPGDELVCERESHIVFAESGGPAALSGVMINGLIGERGVLRTEDVLAAVRPASSFAPRSRLLITEQTSTLDGGTIWPLEQLSETALAAREAGLSVHLDGARIPNAQVATGTPVHEYARHIVMVTLDTAMPRARDVAAALRGKGVLIPPRGARPHPPGDPHGRGRCGGGCTRRCRRRLGRMTHERLFRTICCAILRANSASGVRKNPWPPISISIRSCSKRR